MIAVIGCHANIGRRTAKLARRDLCCPEPPPTNLAEAVVWMQEPSRTESQRFHQRIVPERWPTWMHLSWLAKIVKIIISRASHRRVPSLYRTKLQTGPRLVSWS